MIEALAILAMPSLVFAVLRLEYWLLFEQTTRKVDVLDQLGWTRHPHKDCMVKDGVESDLRLSAYENVMRYKQAMSKIPPKIDIDSGSVDGVDPNSAPQSSPTPAEAQTEAPQGSTPR